MFSFVTRGFLLGLSLGTSCLATCGPVFLPYLLRDKRRWLEGLRELGLFLGGRFFGYALFGALFGLFGMAVPDVYRAVIADSAYILLGGFLIFTTIRRKQNRELCPAHSAKGKFSNPLLLGLFTGMNLCPSFALAIGGAFDTGGPAGGVLLFSGFFFGTSLWFLPMFFLSGISHLKAVRTIAKVFAVIVGGYFLVQGIAGLRLDIPALRNVEEEDVLTENFSYAGLDTIYIVAERSELANLTDAVRPVAPEAVYITIEADSIDHLPEGSHGVMLRDSATEASILEKGGYFISAETGDNIAPFLSEYMFKKRADQGFVFVM